VWYIVKGGGGERGGGEGRGEREGERKRKKEKEKGIKRNDPTLTLLCLGHGIVKSNDILPSLTFPKYGIK
jgi:hypothetical protein